MSRPPRISVVVPVYNEEIVIHDCLTAILAQTTAVYEVIVVDNASTDTTREQLKAFGDRIRVIEEKQQGVQHARTAGMNAATGDVIARIDADTRIPAGWTTVVQRLMCEPGVEAVTGPARYYDVMLPGVLAFLDLFIRRIWVWAGRNDIDWIFGANMAIRRRSWLAVRDSLCHGDRCIHEDLDLGIHLAHAGRRITFSSAMWVGTSSRRIRSSFRDFVAYLRMTEIGYASHSSITRRTSYWRAWATNRILAILYWPCRLLHEAYLRRHCAPASERARRKNPMSEFAS